MFTIHTFVDIRIPLRHVGEKKATYHLVLTTHHLLRQVLLEVTSLVRKHRVKVDPAFTSLVMAIVCYFTIRDLKTHDSATLGGR